MEIILRQLFPLGRFHATRWRANPFDDAFGEWPPSPWRLVRTMVARWYQWKRESVDKLDEREIDELVRALCDSTYRFHLPVLARKGSPIRQYHPVEFGWNPPDKEKAAVRGYGTSLVQDNYWCVPCDEAGAVWWFIQGDRWTDQLVQTLDRCLERAVYFGRAESLTEIRRTPAGAPEPNCQLLDKPRSDLVRVLVPDRTATSLDVQRVTDDSEVAGRSIPPGARLMYAFLPRPRPAREPGVVHPFRTDCHLLQFAIGWNVAPEPRAVVRLTSRFRSVVLRELFRIKTGDPGGTWSTVGASVRTAVADMLGKNADGAPLDGHRHAEFLAWWEGTLPTRLMVWRGARDFDQDEQMAMLRAAAQEISWAEVGPDADAWKIRIIPLDAAVPPPPGFDGRRARVWESVTPLVPSRHHLRGGKARDSESLPNQIRRELALRGVPDGDSVETEEVGQATWVAVHVPHRNRAKRTSQGDRRGYWLRLRFAEPISGPLRLGHSSSFGLGLFRPIA
jgi:hypothetical protein